LSSSFEAKSYNTNKTAESSKQGQRARGYIRPRKALQLNGLNNDGWLRKIAKMCGIEQGRRDTMHSGKAQDDDEDQQVMKTCRINRKELKRKANQLVYTNGGLKINIRLSEEA
jgi:hypothetical protein